MDTESLKTLRSLIETARKDPKAELEVKVLAGQIQTPDVADRIRKAIRGRSVGEPQDLHLLRQMYPDGRRVVIQTPEHIHKVCTSGSFKDLPLVLERKRRYFEAGGTGTDTLDVPDLAVRFTLRQEEVLRKDFQGVPGDPAAFVRLLHRQSYRSADGFFQFDISMVKSRVGKQSIREILKNPAIYEVEIELINREIPADLLMEALQSHIRAIVAAFQGSPFLLLESDVKRYADEWKAARIDFINPITMERRHVRKERPGNILKDYTVTNKADGERSMLWVAKDRRLIRVNNRMQFTWTGIVAVDPAHVGTVLDGEYIQELNLFCVFDVYRFRGQDTRPLPLFTTEDEMAKTPRSCRLGFANLFVEDARGKGFRSTGSGALRIQTKLFLAGDGPAMEASINDILDRTFEYKTDGLIFTPRSSPVAPMGERKGNTWMRVYKWKPADQNSIDFLLRVEGPPSTVSGLPGLARKGALYVSRSPGADIVYPCQQLTGEYVAPELPADLAILAQVRDRIPAVFQPAVPRDPDAYVIYVPVDARGQMVDREGHRVDDNTIIECSFDTDTRRWSVMRTRYDKTYQYRVLRKAQFGNDVAVADSIWTSMHVPVTEDMIRRVTTSPPDDTYEDELYYRDDLDSRDRILRDVYGFHNRIKDRLYKENVTAGNTLLELAVGRAGDLYKWMNVRPSRIVGVDVTETNFSSPRQGACVRVIKERARSTVPPILFVPADMTKNLDTQDHPYLRILRGEEPGTTPYLKQFEGLKEYDAISCQFAIHYACSSEDTFRTFVKNLKGKVFFGTCLDGQSVYSLLLHKPGHIFRSGSRVYAEFTKNYADGEGWKEEFGMGIRVLLESFEKPSEEYLVPFERCREILAESGFALAHTETFGELYSQQADVRLATDQQDFCFLHRAFVFRRSDAEPTPEPEQEVEIPVLDATPEVAPPPAPAPVEAAAPEADVKEVIAEAPKKRKLQPKKAKEAEPAGPEPVLFSTGDESKGPFRVLSTEFVAPMMIDGIKYPTIDHYLLAQKARKFEDQESFIKILRAKTAKGAKGVEKSIQNVKEEEWTPIQDDIMRVGLRAKFTQHKELREKLLESGNRPLAYANARDKYWSIGTSEDTDKAKNPAKWPGKNRLGELLMELREALRGEAV